VQVEFLAHELLDKPSSSLLRSRVLLRYNSLTHKQPPSNSASKEQANTTHCSPGAPSTFEISSHSRGCDLPEATLAEASRLAAPGAANLGSNRAAHHQEQEHRQLAETTSAIHPQATTLHSYDSEASQSTDGSTGSHHQLGPVAIALTGRHQHMNVSSAVACCLSMRAQGWSGISDTAIQEGLAVARLPGRLQVGDLSRCSLRRFAQIVIYAAKLAHTRFIQTSTVSSSHQRSHLRLVDLLILSLSAVFKFWGLGSETAFVLSLDYKEMLFNLFHAWYQSYFATYQYAEDGRKAGLRAGCFVYYSCAGIGSIQSSMDWSNC
jgi:hypothetical protein